MKKPFMKHVTWYLVVAMFVIGITPRVYAGFSASEVVGFSAIDRASDLGKIQNAIETKRIGERLKQIGLTPDEIQKKLSQLGDQQIHQLAQQLDELTQLPQLTGYFDRNLLILHKPKKKVVTTNYVL
jgi:hypothetical protein